jgi:hypothetical protein
MERFKRLRFFKGFFTQAEDWQTEQNYHIEKRKLHKRAFYSPGIVPNYGEELKVKAKGESSFEVSPGYAIDGRGNDIVVYEPALRTIERRDLQTNKPLYISIKYKEKSCHPQRRSEPAYQQDTRIEEGYEILVTPEEPNPNISIELARAYWDKDALKIEDSRKRASLLQAARLVNQKSGFLVTSKKECYSTLEAISLERMLPFYLINVYPEEDTGKDVIKWWITANRSKDKVEYRLYFYNSSNRDIKVSYLAYAF